ncbi:hypothetical protein DYI37_10165 [Fulvimarina endophytica]|uniref:Aldolase n=1 Tax=Fulvimarina endophytica TaxID=2293836 RepID=A0A371X2E5_9HYPH|nr:hypothetical protein DYI37_10165 [Fulvimarina endophytica]
MRCATGTYEPRNRVQGSKLCRQGEADILQSRLAKDKPARVMRIDMGNPCNAERHRIMWSMLQNHEEPIIVALEMDAACVVVSLFMLPDEPELFRQCVENISRVRAACHKYGMPLMIEPLVMLPNDVRGGYQVDGDAEKIVTLLRQGAKGLVYGRSIYNHENTNVAVTALMAMIHQGIDAMTRAKASCEPDPAMTQHYDRRYRVYLAIRDALGFFWSEQGSNDKSA